MPNILLLGAGTQALAILESLHKSGNHLFMITSEKGNYADCSRYIKKVVYTTGQPDSEQYFQEVIKLIKDEKIDTVLPMGDAEALLLSKKASVLKQIVRYKIPSYDIFLKGYDKNKLMSLCREKGYPHPLTIDLTETHYEDAESFASFPFPGILKPNCTTGGRGMCVINTYEELQTTYPRIKQEFGECHFQQFIREGGCQVKVQLYVNMEGELLYSSVMEKVRWYPINGGSSCCSVSVFNPEMVEICHRLLQDIHWVGFADFDTIGNPVTGELLIMEINPRLPACIGNAIYAGMDWGQIIVDDYLDLPHKKYQFKEGVALRHLGFDFLWFLKSPHRFKAKPSWFNFFGSNVHYQDFHFWDQKPFWVGTFHNVKKLFSPEFKKAKSGKL